MENEYQNRQRVENSSNKRKNYVNIYKKRFRQLISKYTVIIVQTSLFEIQMKLKCHRFVNKFPIKPQQCSFLCLLNRITTSTLNKNRQYERL